MNVPKLRFKEFNNEWQSINLADIFQYFSTNSFSREQLSESGILKNLHYGDIHRKYNSIVNENKEITSYVKDINYVNKYELLKNNDLIFADASEDHEGIGKAVEVVNVNNNTVSGLHTILARDNSNVFAPMFKGYYFNSPIVHNQIRVLANGFKVYGISKEAINKLNIKIPSIKEQSKIANTFYLLDKKIELQSKKIEDLKLFKLYTKNQIFKDYDEIFKLKDILVKWNKKNKNNYVKYVESISNKYGFISQSDQFEDRNVASKNLNNYYIIEKGVFGYNPSRLNVGSLALKTNDKVSVVSPLYECFTTSQNKQYLLEWFNSKYFRKETISKFEGGVRNTLNFSNLCEIEIGLPTIEKQNMYSRIFKIFNKKLTIEEEKLDKLFELKKGLMLNMFV